MTTNERLYPTNFKNVWRKGNKYISFFSYAKKRYHCGTFDTIEEALTAWTRRYRIMTGKTATNLQRKQSIYMIESENIIIENHEKALIESGQLLKLGGYDFALDYEGIEGQKCFVCKIEGFECELTYRAGKGWSYHAEKGDIDKGDFMFCDSRMSLAYYATPEKAYRELNRSLVRIQSKIFQN
jgi:hypothetical protein